MLALKLRKIAFVSRLPYSSPKFSFLLVSDKADMDDFTNFLRMVGKKPGFYLASGDSGNCKSIRNLKTFIVGIQVGQHLKTDMGILDGFNEWVCHRCSVAMGALDWSGHILRHAAGDDEKAFQLFFEYFEEYLQEREKVGSEAIKARYLAAEHKI